MRIIFQDVAWQDYLHWQQNDKAILKKLNTIIKEIERTPYEGQGKPEQLKHSLAGWWSRRINLEHRIIYRVEGDTVIILQCRYHY